MPLLDLPNELLIFIAKFLGPKELNSFLQTNRLLSRVCTPLLHDLALDDKDWLPAICWAAKKGHEPLVRLLLKKGVSPSTHILDLDHDNTPLPGASALGLAVERHDIRLVRLLLENGADVQYVDTSDGSTALCTAIWIDNIHICRLLLRAGANPNYLCRHKSMLQAALYAGPDVAFVRLLLESGAEVNALGGAALDLAVRQAANKHQPWAPHRLLITTCLLDWGADINIRSYPRRFGMNTSSRCPVNWETPLHVALPQPELLKFLIERGANLEYKNSKGETPLHRAVSLGLEESVKLLLEGGAMTDTKDLQGSTPGPMANVLATDDNS